MDGKAFSFYLSKDLDEPFKFKIGSLEGERPKFPYSKLIQNAQTAMLPSNVNPISDLIITAQLFSDSKPLTIPVSTTYKSFRSSRKWNEWVTLPIKFNQLPLNSKLAISIWDFSGSHLHCYGGTTVSLFQKSNCTLKTGRQKLKVWLGKEADGASNSTTDSAIVSEREMDRLENLIKEHEAGDIPMVEWLDNLTFRKIELINKNQGNQNENVLYVDFINFDFPLVFSDIEYSLDKAKEKYLNANGLVRDSIENINTNTNGNTYDNINTPNNSKHINNDNKPNIMIINDPELAREDPIENKYRRLVRHHKYSQFDKELKPNPKTRDELNTIINSPTQELTADDKNLLWKFRYYLSRYSQALTKFLRATSWDDRNDSTEAAEAIGMLKNWAEIAVDDALELLGPTFRHPDVRLHAVERLRKANDDELELYLLQLVEALKFEPTTDDKDVSTHIKSPLARFLSDRAARNPILGNYFYWYLVVEAQEKSISAERTFKPVLNHFLTCLQNQSSSHDSPTEKLKTQIKLMRKLLDISRSIRSSKESRPKKLDRLRSFLADSKNGLVSFSPIALPLNPTVKVVGCIPDDSNVFKSSLSPIKITLKTEDGSTYPLILKSGDDLRQDQLVIQIIILMDQLLKKENVDLKLTPYRILATATNEGALQFIPNETIAHVLSEYHGIIPYLQSKNYDESSPYKITPDAMDTYVRSCAGYCVITYILGVGDRHLDNLLICPDGHFFHADYGYILGRDPKAFPPLMKLPMQLIEGMGGISSDNFNEFRKHCFNAYIALRKSANLFLSLFALMTESSIPDIMVDKDKAVQKVREKFCLEMTEGEAMAHFQNLINASVSDNIGTIIDRLHTFAQYWRA